MADANPFLAKTTQRTLGAPPGKLPGGFFAKIKSPTNRQ
jgi:hypothetical protein